MSSKLPNSLRESIRTGVTVTPIDAYFTDGFLNSAVAPFCASVPENERETQCMRAGRSLSPRRQTLSTIGSVGAVERIRGASVRPCLALSLHTADEALRRELLPRAHQDPLRDIVAAADAYGRDIGTPVQFEWTLLRGINDRDEDVDQLCDLLAGVRGYVNFIVYNPVAGLPYQAPDRDRIVAMTRAVKARGILAKIRDSSGPDAQAALDAFIKYQQLHSFFLPRLTLNQMTSPLAQTPQRDSTLWRPMGDGEGRDSNSRAPQSDPNIAHPCWPGVEACARRGPLATRLV